MYNKTPIIAECRSIIRPFSICIYTIYYKDYAFYTFRNLKYRFFLELKLNDNHNVQLNE